jgi:hypothetical protein
MAANIKITAKQIRFMFDSGKVWMIQPLHRRNGVPKELQGHYSVPSDEWQNCGWGGLDAKQEEKILRQWVRLGYRL